jgi:TolA-binding protein
MSINPLANLASGYIQSLFTSPVNGSSSTNTTRTSSTGSSGSTQDTNQLSSFAQIVSSLQQLQQSNQSQYQQVTQQVSNNLQTAAQTATADGNTSLASKLTQLSTDFKNASTSGQLPNVQDLAKAIGGGHHHHHHGGTSPASPASSNTDSSASNGTAGGNLNSFIQSLNASQTVSSSANNSLNPLSIINNTLSSAGVPIG